MRKKAVAIAKELKSHAPFTMFGALTGIILMLVFKDMRQETSFRMFYILHPAHVALSAMVTASMFKLHTRQRRFVIILAIGILGSIGIATLSDSLIPYLGEGLLGMHVHLHGHEHIGFAQRAHIGFIEGWPIVLPAAVLGVLIAYFKPKTKFPHAGHVLLSTWASSVHMLMAMAGKISPARAIGSFVFLFLAVWLPCCISDIVFPLLFAGDKVKAENPHS